MTQIKKKAAKQAAKKAAKKTFKKGSNPRFSVTFHYCERHQQFYPRGATCPWCSA